MFAPDNVTAGSPTSLATLVTNVVVFTSSAPSTLVITFPSMVLEPKYLLVWSCMVNSTPPNNWADAVESNKFKICCNKPESVGFSCSAMV